MAAITEKRNRKTQRMTLSSSEFPDLKVEGRSANESSLRKQLNAMMREKRRKSGGPTGKSPTEKKVEKTPEKKDAYQGRSSDLAFIKAQADKKPKPKPKPKPEPEPKPKPKKKVDTYQGRKSDIAFINKQKAQKKIDQKKFNRGPTLDSAIPEKPDPKTKLSSLPHIRKQQLAERKRKSEARESQLAPKPTSVKSKRSHPLLTAQDRKKAQEEEEASRLQADQFDGTVKEKELQRPSNVNKRIWDDAPPHMRRKLIKNANRRDAKASHLTGGFPKVTPRDQSPPENIPDSREEYVKKVNKMVEEGKITEEEGNRVLKGNERFPIITPRDQRPPENIPDSRDEYVKKIKMMLARGEIDPNSAEVKRILGENYLAKMHGDGTPDAGEELEAMDKKLKAESVETGTVEKTDLTNTDGGLMKKPEAPTTGEVTEEPLKFDKNGYPIYHKDSKKAAEWNKAYANAPVGNFMWDGREYVKEGKPEDQEAAVAVRQSYDTGDANLAEASYRAPEKAQPMAQGEWETSEEQAKDKYSPEKIAEDIIKIKEDTNFTPHDSEKLIKEKVKPLNKEDTADAKEKAGDWYVDPWTGFAIDLNKLQKRQDRKDAMEFAALLPADQRAAYLSQEGLIEPEDLEKLLEPSDREKLELQRADILLKQASFNLIQSKIQAKEYKTPEELADIELKKTVASEKRAEQTQIRKEDRAPTSNKAQMDRYAGLYKNAITNDDFHGQVYWGMKMDIPKAEIAKLAKQRAAWEIKQEKNKAGVSAFKEIFEFDYNKVVASRTKLLMGTASLWEDGQIDIQMGGRQIKSREGLLNTLGIEDYDDMTAQDISGNPVLSEEEAIRMISSQSNLTIFNNRDYQDENGNPDWMSILEDEDVYKQFVLDNALYKGMNAIYGGEYADILKYEHKRRKKRYDEGGSLRAVTTNQG